ncbi:hypothetical protein B0H67DRAFT_583900 [Lasiosphaeris hirsuta]|uniref:Uncharacterized protein n=1 Tax=Lasiosphaeris hirsuta TaxID=260670 RepID=A0AA40DPM8_9PEZI|nr:hypothetical protein B0H67DRAFT_583900 [Lasiosphaeris hirsuta]
MVSGNNGGAGLVHRFRIGPTGRGPPRSWRTPNICNTCWLVPCGGILLLPVSLATAPLPLINGLHVVFRGQIFFDFFFLTSSRIPCSIYNLPIRRIRSAIFFFFSCFSLLAVFSVQLSVLDYGRDLGRDRGWEDYFFFFFFSAGKGKAG